MHKNGKLIIAVALFSCSSLSFAASCTNTIENNTVSTITVPAGANCTLNNSSIEGDVNIGKGGSLILNSSSIQGSIQANQAKAIKLINSSVSGDIHIAQAVTTLSLDKSIISGNIHCSTSTKLQSNLSNIEGQKIGKCG